MRPAASPGEPEGRRGSREGPSFRPLLLLLVVATPVLLAPGVPREAAALFPLEPAGHPYLVTTDPWLVYLALPAVTVSALGLVLSPGLILAAALGRARELDSWVLWGFGISLVLVGSVTSGLSWLGASPRGRTYALVLLALSLGCLALTRLIGRRGNRLGSLPAPGVGTLLTYLLPAVLLLVGLAPKFLWESFNGDGAHAFEASRLLLEQPLPFWDPAAGPVSRFPGLTTMLFAFPASWFVRLFGEVEFAVRVPYLLHVTALYAVICALSAVRVEGGKRAGALEVRDRWLVWLGLTVFTAVIAFSATYNPYHADIALPGAQDTLFLACFLGFVYAFVRGDLPGMALFLALSATALPSWSLATGLWLLAALAVWRPLPRRRLVQALTLMVAGIAVLALLPRVLAGLSLPLPGNEHAPGQLIERLRFVRFTAWHRWLYLLIPAGGLPALYMVFWRRQDRLARTLTVAAVAYFLFFYVQGYSSLHHFLPAAVLPLVVLWRDRSRGRARAVLRTGVLVAGVAALALALPPTEGIHTHGKEVGLAVRDARDGYERFDPGLFASLDAYWSLFGRPPEPDVPERRYGGSPLVWNYYAHHRTSPRRTTYLWLAAGGSAPGGARLVNESAEGALYVLDVDRWRRDRSHVETASIAPLLAIPDSLLFRGVGRGKDPGVFDLRALLGKLLEGRP